VLAVPHVRGAAARCGAQPGGGAAPALGDGGAGAQRARGPAGGGGKGAAAGCGPTPRGAATATQKNAKNTKQKCQKHTHAPCALCGLACVRTAGRLQRRVLRAVPRAAGRIQAHPGRSPVGAPGEPARVCVYVYVGMPGLDTRACVAVHGTRMTQLRTCGLPRTCACPAAQLHQPLTRVHVVACVLVSDRVCVWMCLAHHTQSCAMWHDAPTVLPMDACDVIDNLAVRPSRECMCVSDTRV
jgi:hypothetical protein